MSTWKWITYGWDKHALFIPDRLHKLWPFRPLMCWMGRHDYEAEAVDPFGVLLRCFYCSHKNYQIDMRGDLRK